MVWRRTCSAGDPTPQRQCAWLLSTYLKEGEEQKEVLEAEDDKEEENEIDGEVEERVTQRAHGDDCGMNEAQTRALDLLSHSVMCKESNEDDTKEALHNKQTNGTHESSVWCTRACSHASGLRPR